MSSIIQNAKILFALVFVILLAACSSAPKVATDYDQNYNFSAIKSYHLVDQNQAAYIGEPGTSLADQRVTRAIAAEMQKRGIPEVSVDKADIIVTFHIVTQDKTRVTSYNTAYGYRGYGYGYASPYNGRSQVDVRQYVEGTLLIDLVSPAEKRTVWRGQSSAILKTISNEEREARAKAYVEAIFAHMPPPLGSKQ